MFKQFTQVREGLHIDFNVPIEVSDGHTLSANVYRPVGEGRYPAILTYGPYCKDLHFSEIYSSAWKSMLKDCPEIALGSSNTHQSWEVLDPELWCPFGYVIIRVDSRGAGQSPGFMDPWSSRETQDVYDCIEWAAKQPWCTGKVGMSGISYYAVNAWQVAALQPPHLAAIVCWEGFNDAYRHLGRPGGIMSEMQINWMKSQVIPVQYGRGVKGYRSRVNGLPVSGNETLSEEELLRNRIDPEQAFLEHRLLDDYYKDHSVSDYSEIKVPLLSAGNWGGQTLHLKGNIDGFVLAGSENKWLEVHGKEHWTPYYSKWGMELQKAFLDHFLKGVDNGFEKRPRVELKVRYPGDKFVSRFENEWPIARTKYAKLYFDPDSFSLTDKPTGKKGTFTYRGMSDSGVTFLTPPMKEEVEITGHSLAKLMVASSTTDADIFLVLRLFQGDLEEITFKGSIDPNTPLAFGWLRASHRKMDGAKSTGYQPYHTHDELWPLEPGKPVDMTVEIWPTCIVIPKGYRLGLTIRGKDYVNAVAKDGRFHSSHHLRPATGVGSCYHEHPQDRPPEIFDGEVTLHFNDETYLQVPVIPPKESCSE